MDPRFSKFSIGFLCALMLISDASKYLHSKEKSDFSFGAELEASVGNESNVVVEEIDLSTTRGDSFFVVKAKGDIEYAFSSQHSVSAGISYTDKNYFEADRFSLQTTLSSAGYKFKHADYTLSFDYRNASADLGGNDFLTLTHVSPAISFFLDKKNFLRLAYTNIDKELINNPTRDAQSDEIGVDYYYFWNGLSDYFISSVKLRQEDAIDPVFNFSSYQLRLAYKKRYSVSTYKLRLTVEGKYRERDFNDRLNPRINAFRADDRATFSLSNEAEIIDDLFWHVALSYVNNDSNLASASYSETSVASGISYQF
ncbi:surface lipoprotein assembly modifier [Brumicola nitratireducens]|uniref:DUF2860 domain-containing protein n=1 Tax=Glaciecola nitratireducens (strain JCM 12485 / KCTC 12276 / FR1064) TaxID=1085623 RepID=G4QDU0_GLANF|nr:surface lipoprotein assembly modifier [Glaciecola nitratireducens]AEP31119.1 hypothetical protein GNIT_3023 [Glaciecola nitratireducens FR1064]